MSVFEKLESFYKGKKVFLTGNTGFKGSWLSTLLIELKAEVYGYALKPNTEPAVFDILGLSGKVNAAEGDIRDLNRLSEAFLEAEPDIILHLAAQPIVRESYLHPRETYETNVMGTVNLLECIRQYPKKLSLLNVTTDKVYYNPELSDHAFTEEEMLDGFDPYSNSKSCSELVTHSYKSSFFSAPDCEIAVSTARAGNVIGGGDFAADRIIPDCVRAAVSGKPVRLRNPNSTRPYQHVLEPLCAYLLIAMSQYEDKELSGCYNVGPDEADAITTGRIADLFVKSWGDKASREDVSEKNAPHEASYLKLDSSKVKQTFGWKPVWNVEEAVRHSVEWYRAYYNKEDMYAFTVGQIKSYCSGTPAKDLFDPDIIK